MKKDEYIEQLEQENMGLVTKVEELQTLIMNEIKKNRAENARVLDKITKLTEKVDDIEGYNSTLIDKVDMIALKHRKVMRSKHPIEEKDSEANEEIDRAWQELKKEAKEIELREQLEQTK